MLNVNLVEINQMHNSLVAVAHVGNLETVINISIDELPSQDRQAILAILQNYVNNADTSVILAKLVK